MDALKIKKAEELFRSAVGLTTEKRVSFLTEQCGDDVALRTFVEDLLAHDATGMGDFLCKPAFTASMVMRECQWSGVAMITASTSPLSSKSL